jgi:hypothetical protein
LSSSKVSITFLTNDAVRDNKISGRTTLETIQGIINKIFKDIAKLL